MRDERTASLDLRVHRRELALDQLKRCDRATELPALPRVGQGNIERPLRKANALYCEFEEVGMNRQLGYTSPADLTDLYPQFYWNSISPHIQRAIQYLNVTSSGRQWIASLSSNVFRAERDLNLCGPQR